MWNLCLFIVIFLATCGDMAHKADVNTASITVVKPDEPATNIIRVKVNDSFSVKLRGTPGTGYTWSIRDSSTTGNTQYMKQDFKNLAPQRDGGPGLQTFYFKALRQGKDTLCFVYTRPFEKPPVKDPPAKTFMIDIY